jgi:hypothetical protein
VEAEGHIASCAGRCLNNSFYRLANEQVNKVKAGVEGAFGCDIDYAMLIELYGARQDGGRYSSAECMGSETSIVVGKSGPKHIRTSYVDGQNLTMPVSMRRLTRLANGFSTKIENHASAVAGHYMHYNFRRIHRTLRVTPAVEAGITDPTWTIEELLTSMGLQIAFDDSE